MTYMGAALVTKCFVHLGSSVAASYFYNSGILPNPVTSSVPKTCFRREATLKLVHEVVFEVWN